MEAQDDVGAAGTSTKVRTCFTTLVLSFVRMCKFSFSKQSKSKRLDMLRWTAAFQCFALGAEAAQVSVFRTLFRQFLLCCVTFSVQVWTFPAAMAHFRVCLGIAVQATSEGRRQSLGQIYDEVARREWAEKARRGTHIIFFVIIYRVTYSLTVRRTALISQAMLTSRWHTPA